MLRNSSDTLTLVRDGSYGSKDGGGWNGMIGELVQNVRILGYLKI